MSTQLDKYEGLRIYTVVPGTVQTPIKVTYTPDAAMVDGVLVKRIKGAGEIYSFGRFENTRDIVQPAGRQAQQVGHVARMVEHWRIMQALQKEIRRGLKRHSASIGEVIPYAPITGIVKKCRDSFELLHVKSLLEKANIRFFEFEDTQEGLYENVVTALATEPVTPFALNGILDYLPLWDGK
jgi:hypothetical protein